jgi:hypothetical protein
VIDFAGLVLGPLASKPEAAWQQAPPGKWTSAQIVEHLALAMEMSAKTFASRSAKEPMARRGMTFRERVGKIFTFGLGRFPPGLTAPERTTPPPQVDARAAEAHFRAAVAAWEQVARDLLPARRDNLFVKHPRLGDLTLEEWGRFHAVHARHHARQIRARLRG